MDTSGEYFGLLNPILNFLKLNNRYLESLDTHILFL
jgi:hypothetical protein